MRNLILLLYIFFFNAIGANLLAQTPEKKNTTNQYLEKKGKYEVTIHYDPFRFEVIDIEKNKNLIATKGSIILKRLLNTDVIYKKPYTFFISGRKVDEVELTKITKHESKEDTNYFYLGNSKKENIAILKFRFNADSTFLFELSEIKPASSGIREISQMSISFDSDSTDNYLGMGMRYNTTNHKGTIVSHWADEVGVNLPIVSENATTQGRDITYAPVPFYINTKGCGLFLNSYNYSEFDFAKTQKQRMKITNASGNLKFKFFLGDSPLDIVGKYMKGNGEYSLPKPWVFGVWAAAGTDYQSKENGQEVNYDVLKTCRENKIPLSAIMAEDWYFDFLSLKPIEDWTVNRKYYPQYEKMIEDQHRAGVKNIGYFLPYLSKKKLFSINNTFLEADSKGLLTKNKKNESYLFKFGIWREAQFDWTNPAASNYFHSKFYGYLEKKGVDGWMNDFGEYTPYNSISYNGELGNTMHNRYPLLWAKNANDFFKKTRPNGDYCIFSRSGAAGLHQYNSFIFTGDRNATYEKLSGLGGQITGVLNASMSVHPNVSVDIGAYNCEKTKPMNKLMMFRWIELGALIPVMRLHRGLQLCDHWRFDEDEETLMQWKKYTSLHAKLFPYIYTLAKESVDKGLPIVRHLSLHNPSDANSANQDFEFLLGDRILSCPVIDEQVNGDREDMSKARNSWRVYLPTGNWYHYWTNKIYIGGAYYDVPASPGFLPMFIKEGKIIPTFNKIADSFVENVEDPNIKDFEDVNQSIEIYFYGFGNDTLTLWDGTVIHCSREKYKSGIFEVLNGNNRKYSVIFID